MKIELVTPQEIIGLRSRLPRSTFMDETFDEHIIGVYKENGSIVYNLYGVIHAMIEEEYPDLKDKVESDEWCDAYDEIDEHLRISNAFYGLEALLENSDDFQNNELRVSYTLSGDLDLINYNGDKKTLEFTTNLNLL